MRQWSGFRLWQRNDPAQRFGVCGGGYTRWSEIRKDLSRKQQSRTHTIQVTVDAHARLGVICCKGRECMQDKDLRAFDSTVHRLTSLVTVTT